MTDHQDRCISIVLYGFTTDPDEIADLIDPATDTVLRIGEPTGNRLSDRHQVTWRQVIFNDTPWDDGFESLLTRLGGVQNFKSVLYRLKPADAWVRINLPIISSPLQESNGFGSENLTKIAELNLDLDIMAITYDAARPSHNLKPDK